MGFVHCAVLENDNLEVAFTSGKPPHCYTDFVCMTLLSGVESAI